MLRVKDPKISIKFYEDNFGMELIDQHDGGDFTLYFLAFDHSNGSQTAQEKADNRFSREGVLELTHNHGTETDASFKGYASGNDEPGKGFGHIAISVDDVQKSCDRLESLGVRFKKRPQDGKMKHIAFALDPDGYWIEIVPGKHASAS